MPDPTSSDLTPTCDPASRRRISSGGHRHPLVITQLLTLGAQLHNVSRVWFPGLLWVVWGLGWDWVVTRRARVGLNVFLLPFWHENANTATSHQPATSRPLPTLAGGDQGRGGIRKIKNVTSQVKLRYSAGTGCCWGLCQTNNRFYCPFTASYKANSAQLQRGVHCEDNKNNVEC